MSGIFLQLTRARWGGWVTADTPIINLSTFKQAVYTTGAYGSKDVTMHSLCFGARTPERATVSKILSAINPKRAGATIQQILYRESIREGMKRRRFIPSTPPSIDSSFREWGTSDLAFGVLSIYNGING